MTTATGTSFTSSFASALRWPPRTHRGTAAVAAALAVATSPCCPSPASAAVGMPPPPGPRAVGWTLSALGGAVQLDPHLTDYRWDAGPQVAFGLQATAQAGRWLLGTRAASMQTTQGSGIPGEATALRVRLTTVEALGGLRLATVARVELLGAVTGGWAHLGYDPDRMVFAPPTGGSEIVVDFAPIDTWIASAGLWLRRRVAANLGVGLQLDRSYFALDTAHRNGAAVEQQRETFGNWEARVELSWVLGAP